ncbi:HEPN domain-containing protein [Ignisphaera sp. 4213-co]|uniref:HEPN domain-containing protein n=1 Tax=Ignisphaera cupida TaxID=3050454 RepID=A0ABD4Z6V7_9CREN|nr:HEPN domain-containing protein [Ignisphaera sp. 4213-co]MDK6028925.1 HEPN domain-containing protein [Ignisphaera sp. 4213-co]
MRREAFMWLKQAESDLKKALNDLVTGDWDSAAFWSQQAAEKALKALLLEHGLVYRGHELLEIANLIEKELNINVDEVRNLLRDLTIHYVISRYPNAANGIPAELYTKDIAESLVEKARRVVEWVKQYLH